MDIPNAIQEQWKKPLQWKVLHEEDAIEVADEEGDFVMSSMTHDHVSETIEEHVKKVQTAATLEMLLSMSDEHDA